MPGRASSAGNSSWYFWQQIRATKLSPSPSLTLVDPTCIYHHSACPPKFPDTVELLLRVACGGGYAWPCGQFCWQMPHTHSYYDGQMPVPPVHPIVDQYTKLLVTIFNKHNCFSSLELHKTGNEMSHSD